jgi:hypothetical protein
MPLVTLAGGGGTVADASASSAAAVVLLQKQANPKQQPHARGLMRLAVYCGRDTSCLVHVYESMTACLAP